MGFATAAMPAARARYWSWIFGTPFRGCRVKREDDVCVAVLLEMGGALCMLRFSLFVLNLFLGLQSARTTLKRPKCSCGAGLRQPALPESSCQEDNNMSKIGKSVSILKQKIRKNWLKFRQCTESTHCCARRRI